MVKQIIPKHPKNNLTLILPFQYKFLNIFCNVSCFIKSEEYHNCQTDPPITHFKNINYHVHT